MILFLIEFLKEYAGVTVPAVFSYYSTKNSLAALTSLLLSIFLGPFFIRKLYEMKIGQTIRKEECPLLGKLHEKKQNTPTMGGILILFSMLISLVLWMDLTHVFTLILFVTTLFLGLIGGRDDYLKLKYKNTKGMSAKGKLFFQFLLASSIAAYVLWAPASHALAQGKWFQPPVIKEHVLQKSSEVSEASSTRSLSLKEYGSRIYIPFFKEPILMAGGFSLLLMGLFIFFIIVGSSNAVNLTDGLDGLAAGCLIMVAGSLGLIAFAIQSHGYSPLFKYPLHRGKWRDCHLFKRYDGGLLRVLVV